MICVDNTFVNTSLKNIKINNIDMQKCTAHVLYQNQNILLIPIPVYIYSG